MTENYIDLYETIINDTPGLLRSDTRVVLNWLDSHPDQVSGRTITHSEFDALVDTLHRNWAGPEFFSGALSDALEDLGITVVPDPEPTNAQKLGAIIAEKFRLEYRGNPYDALGIGRYLDEAGVKAPGGEPDAGCDRAWWIENANVNDAEDCEACGVEEDLCPVHHGIAVGVDMVTKKLAALAGDPELFARIPDLKEPETGNE